MTHPPPEFRLRIRRNAYVVMIGHVRFKIQACEVTPYISAIPARTMDSARTVPSRVEYAAVVKNTGRFAVGAWFCDAGHVCEAHDALGCVLQQFENTYAHTSPAVLRVARAMADAWKERDPHIAQSYFRFAFWGSATAAREVGRESLFQVYDAYAGLLMNELSRNVRDTAEEIMRVIDIMARVCDETGAADKIHSLEITRLTCLLFVKTAKHEERCGARFRDIGLYANTATKLVIAAIILDGEDAGDVLGGWKAAEERLLSVRDDAKQGNACPFAHLWVDLALTYVIIVQDKCALSDAHLRRILAAADSEEVRCMPASDAACKLLNGLLDARTMAERIAAALGERRGKKRCAACGNGGSGRLRLRLCSRCNRVRYCSDQCIRADWPEHKTACTPKFYDGP